MLVRQMFGYAPSLLVTGLMSFASLYCFTRVMPPVEFGEYSLAITAMTMLIGVSFSWLQSAASRLMPHAVQQGKDGNLYAVIYSAFAACGFALLGASCLLLIFMPDSDWRIAAWFAPPLAILRALLNINQAFHRNFVQIARYNLIEIGQALIGFASAIALIVLLHWGASGAVIGLMIGLAAMAMLDWRMIVDARRYTFDWGMFRDVTQFGLPFVANYGFSFIISGSDRFLIEHFLGPDQVGIYSAGYAFPDRIGQYLFMAVATASFPLVIRRMEQEGAEVARDQTYTNGIAILALAVPACVGMLLANRQIAATLIGENFRAGAIQVMPWIAVAMIFNGVAAHYFDHALHLAKKTRLFFLTLGPAAALNFVANLYAIPHYGIMGAAYTTVAGYALYLVLSIVIGRSVFRIKFPFKPALQILASAGAMTAILSAFAFSEDSTGLVEMIALGGLVYTTGLLAFDILGARRFLAASFVSLRAKKIDPVEGLDCAILTDIGEVEKIAIEWQQLADRKGQSLFGSYGWFALWWSSLGKRGGCCHLHIVTARVNGRLTAVLPLVVRRSGLLRILEWAGYEVFDYGDVLAESPRDAQGVWQHIYAKGHYDVALIKDVHAKASALPVLTQTMQLREQRRNYFLTLDFASGEAWLAAQSRKLRGDTRRKTEKMQGKGPVTFHVHRNGDPVPAKIIDALYAQKAAWFDAREASGVFSRAEIKDFLCDLAQDAAQQGTLYLAWLSSGDAVVACHMGFVRSEVLYLYHTTYDAAYGAFSPGNILMIETIKWAIDARLRELDFMRGDEAYKQRFASGTRALSAFVSSRSIVGRVSVWLNVLRRGQTDTGDVNAEESAEAKTPNTDA
jgi:O-antigen/teichoic acid export membrane protein/CelD/BcsL family acetyltransferase involved in cellulose biosynthesis